MSYSVVKHTEGYAIDVVDGFDNKREATEYAQANGYEAVVKGTQMWNKRLGVIEENDNEARYWYISRY